MEIRKSTHNDIKDGNSYVCLNEAGNVAGVFYFIQGKNIEPTYKNISEGKWTGSDTYGVVHRLAGDGSEKGIGAFCIDWAFSKCGNLRIDTHGDNIVMQNLLRKTPALDRLLADSETSGWYVY